LQKSQKTALSKLQRSQTNLGDGADISIDVEINPLASRDLIECFICIRLLIIQGLNMIASARLSAWACWVKFVFRLKEMQSKCNIQSGLETENGKVDRRPVCFDRYRG
jgi:hypothetical protein